MKNRRDSRGFIALISVIIISAILITLIFTLGVSSFFNRFSVLDTENKRISLALAESCANIAMIKVAQNSSYVPPAGGECIGVSNACGAGPRTCKICQTSPYILVRAVYNNAYTNLRVEGAVSGSNFSVSRWQELDVNPVAGCSVP